MMLSTCDVFKATMTPIGNKHFKACLIDFFTLCPTIPLDIKIKHRDFRDQLIRRFPSRSQEYPITPHRQYNWTIEILCSQIIDDVLVFNTNFKSMPESHKMVFVCLDNDLLPYQEALLKRSYVNSVFFKFDGPADLCSERIFDYLKGKRSRTVVQDDMKSLYALLLHNNSNGTGLALNYGPYLNRQISSTNNIFLTLTFPCDISDAAFPKEISVVFNTLIESHFLEKSPTTFSSTDVKRIQSKVLHFKFDATQFKSFNGKETNVTFALTGTLDWGFSIEKIRIWLDSLDLIDSLSKLQLKDDVRGWNEEYQSVDHNFTEEMIYTLEKRDDPTKKCYFMSLLNIPRRDDGHPGVSTMRKTSKDCYDRYIADPRNGFTEEGERIDQILIVPVYYIIMPSSCRFGPPDTSQGRDSDRKIRQGIIIDPDRIQLAYVDREVLRSRPMQHFNRYVRRTYYYVDQINAQKKIIRYLFCAEYPYILSVLDQWEKSGRISSAEKHEEYFRFCNILTRFIQSNHCSESVKLIQFDDQENNIAYADFQSLWDQVKADIDQWYQTTDEQIFSFQIDPRIVQSEPQRDVLLFFTDQARENPLIMTLIEDLKTKLRMNDYLVNDAEGDLNLIESEKQIIFICTGNRNDPINRSIINSIIFKMNRCGVVRDVFILINDTICYFPCRFLRSIPFLNFDLQRRPAQLNEIDVQEILLYLNNMNVLAKNYTDVFEETNQLLKKSPLQCTSIGAGCAAAFVFNYLKLLVHLPDHQHRMKAMQSQVLNENAINFGNHSSISISKWVFILPWTIKDTTKLFSYALSLTENEQQTIGLKLSLWKPSDPTFIIPPLSVTVGGVVDRSYSPLSIYKLTDLRGGKSYYFPMEIPGALHGLQSAYENILCHFDFGTFDPVKQAMVFAKKAEQLLSEDQDKQWQENILLISLQKLHLPNGIGSISNFQIARVLLETLCHKLSLNNQVNL